MADAAKLAADALSAGNGILRLKPTWVPRSFLQPGRQLKLRPQDYYAMGMHRGGLDERWFESKANEGGTFENPGMDPLVGLCYFGPDAQPNARANGA